MMAFIKQELGQFRIPFGILCCYSEIIQQQQPQHMAPPPKYIIERRLIKKFMGEYLPKQPLLPPEYYSNMFDCWKRHGAGSIKCREQQKQFDFATNQSTNYREKLQNMGFAKMVTNTLKKPTYDFNLRGRHKKTIIESFLKMI